MRNLICAAALVAGTPALAHPGHLSEVAGHGHWLGAAAIGAAIAIGLWAGLRGRKDAAESDAAGAQDGAGDDEAQEA